MNVFALSFLAMLVLVLAERFWLQKRKRRVAPWRDLVLNLNSGHIVMWAFRGVELLAFALVLQHASFGWVGQWPAAWQWLFALLAWDLCFYWMHRLHHTVPLLWAVHQVHHAGEHFDLSLGIRNSWYSSLSSFPFMVVLAVVGVPLEVFLVVSSLHYSVQFYNHNAVVGRSGWLDQVMVTPSNHRVHHGTHPLYIDKNFGGTLLLWDKLFGSYQAERADIPLQYGLATSIPTPTGTDKPTAASRNPLWANHPALLAWWQRRLAHRPPPARAALRVSDSYIGAGGVLLFVLVIAYVNAEAHLNGARQALLFGALVLGTVALGGQSDGKRWGLVLWAAVMTCLPVLVAAVWGWFSHGLFPSALALSLHAWAGLLELARARAPLSPGEQGFNVSKQADKA